MYLNIKLSIIKRESAKTTLVQSETFRIFYSPYSLSSSHFFIRKFKNLAQKLLHFNDLACYHNAVFPAIRPNPFKAGLNFKYFIDTLLIIIYFYQNYLKSYVSIFSSMYVEV